MRVDSVQQQHHAKIYQQVMDVISTPGQDVLVVRKDGTQVLGRIAKQTAPTVVDPTCGSVTIAAADGKETVNKFEDMESIQRLPFKSN